MPLNDCICISFFNNVVYIILQFLITHTSGTVTCRTYILQKNNLFCAGIEPATCAEKANRFATVAAVYSSSRINFSA